MSVIVNKVRKGFFLDSVALMRISRMVAGCSAVEEAALMMGTSANKEIMSAAGLLNEVGEAAAGGDLVLGVRAKEYEAASAALEVATEFLAGPQTASDVGTIWRPKSLRTGSSLLKDANLALISVPGDFAAAEARKALMCGLNVMVFSDNVAIEEERALKEEARARGLLLMGPDCGTAIIAGVPLGFANEVPRGDIAILGASGTGMQEISSLIARSGKGISHGIGVGGRDLSSDVGGISTFAALDLLDADDSTRHIVVVSKPPSTDVSQLLLKRVSKSKKEFTLCLLGEKSVDVPGNALLVDTLKAAAVSASGDSNLLSWDPAAVAKPLGARRNGVLGLFSGGTLAAEAQYILMAAGETVASNAQIPGTLALGAAGDVHAIIDLGSDEFTRGRPHPMIDPMVRDMQLREALGGDRVGIILLDIVIGHGAHADPASPVVEAIKAAETEHPLVIASVTGTDNDPQSSSAQEAKLAAAGVLVAPSNADAVGLALACLRSVG